MDTYELKDIDVGFDFTSDTAHYWDGFWKEDDLGWSKMDPDSKVQPLGGIDQLLWSPGFLVGRCMQLTDGRSRYYLRWEEFYLEVIPSWSVFGILIKGKCWMLSVIWFLTIILSWRSMLGTSTR